MQEKPVARGDLLFLWHPTAPQLFSGYGLVVYPGRKDQLNGLLMIDRPRPASSQWLAKVEQTFGDCALYPMTASLERGIACQMWIHDDNLPYVRRLDQPKAAQIRMALLPMLEDVPKPTFRVYWDPVERLWNSAFLTKEEPAGPPLTQDELWMMGSDAYAVRSDPDNDIPNETCDCTSGEQPDLETLMRWTDEGGCEATDSCWVEPDGTCIHGCRSWLLELGLI